VFVREGGETATDRRGPTRRRLTGNDPYAAHYAMVEPDSVTLFNRVQGSAEDIAELLSYRSDDDPTTESAYPTPGGNWGPGVWWIWAPSGVRWDPYSLTIGF
jgi:hypothetical protein